MLEKYLGPQLEMVICVTLEEFHESGEEWGYYLQPLTSIYLHSDLQYEIQANGSITTVSFQAYMAARLNPVDTLRDE